MADKNIFDFNFERKRREKLLEDKKAERNMTEYAKNQLFPKELMEMQDFRWFIDKGYYDLKKAM
jgi:hypothetical protein